MDVLLERYMETASGEYRRKAAVNSLSMVGESRKVVYHVAGDLNGDGVEEVAVVTSRPSENGLYLWSFSVYGWKDYSYSRAFEEELGPFRENLDVRPHEEGLPREFWRGLHLRFVSFVPEIVLIFQESSGEWTHFGWDGKKYVRLQRYDVD